MLLPTNVLLRMVAELPSTAPMAPPPNPVGMKALLLRKVLPSTKSWAVPRNEMAPPPALLLTRLSTKVLFNTLAMPLLRTTIAPPPSSVPEALLLAKVLWVAVRTPPACTTSAPPPAPEGGWPLRISTLSSVSRPPLPTTKKRNGGV